MRERKKTTYTLWVLTILRDLLLLRKALRYETGSDDSSSDFIHHWGPYDVAFVKNILLFFHGTLSFRILSCPFRNGISSGNHTKD